MPYTDKLTALSNSIKAKNPSYTGTLSLAKMKEAVDNISSGVDTSVITATAADALATKKILLADGTIASGSIANNGAVSKVLTSSSKSYTIPAGYHNGSGKISISTQSKTVTPSTSSQSITADSGKVLTGVTVNAASMKAIRSGSFSGSSISNDQIKLGIDIDGYSYDVNHQYTFICRLRLSSVTELTEGSLIYMSGSCPTNLASNGSCSILHENYDEYDNIYYVYDGEAYIDIAGHSSTNWSYLNIKADVGAYFNPNAIYDWVFYKD